MKDKIYPYLMNMLFENLFNRIENITYEDIKFDYWDYKEEVKELYQNDREEQKGGGTDTSRIRARKREEEVALKKKKPEPNPDVFEFYFEKQYFKAIATMLRRYLSRQE